MAVTERFGLAVHAPHAQTVEAAVDGETDPVSLTRDGDGDWVGDVPVGGRYVLLVDGRPVLDPRATAVWFPPGHSRAANEPDGALDPATFPRAVALPWPAPRPARRTTRPLVVYEAHAKGLTRRRNRADAGTYSALRDELPRLAGLGVSVIELLPVHQYDPDEGNYWGYMPVAFGALHEQYAAGEEPGAAVAELAEFVAAAHDHDIEVWLDVVVNHTSESDRDGPTYTLRALDEGGYYATRPDGSYLDDTGTGNMIDVCQEPARRLIDEALDRLADLGVDGLRFDLAAVLARDPDVVTGIGDWAERRGVRVIAEPWDLARYLLGPDFPDDRWMQWNGEFRDDVRGFLRGEPAMVPALMHRVAGSPDLFADPSRSVNFLTAHDGFTLYDLVSYDRRHNLANGWDGTDGHHDNRSWNCGWEGDEGVPDDVLALRRRQMRNAWCLLLCSRGVPMWTAGDEVARTQGGNNNAYNQDNETSWVDWERAAAFVDLERFVGALVARRAATPGLADVGSREPFTFFGADGDPDVSHESRSLGWQIGDLCVLANAWWEPVEFTHLPAGDWRRTFDTTREDGHGDGEPVGDRVVVDARSVVVLSQ